MAGEDDQRGVKERRLGSSVDTDARSRKGARKGSGWPAPEIAIALLAAGLIAFLGRIVGDLAMRCLLVAALMLITGTYIGIRLWPVQRRSSFVSAWLFALTTLFFGLILIGIFARLISDIPYLIILSAGVVFLSCWLIIFRLSATRGLPQLIHMVRDYLVVIAGFSILVVVGVMVAVAADLATPAGVDFRATLLQGLSGSLIEDLVFFSLVGFLLILLQRRDADRNRNIDDKIDLLFNAKTLRSGETAYLREKIRKISADCREATTSIDVIEHDRDRDLIRIDVSRQYYVGNYLSAEPAIYSLEGSLTPVVVEGHSPSMVVFPTITNGVTRASGEWQRVADDEVLNEKATFDTSEPFRILRDIEIPPGQVREFRTRFQAWQHIYEQAPLAAYDAPPVAGELDGYVVRLLKHWDQLEFHVRNSLSCKLEVTISGDTRSSFTLLPGDERRKAYRVENLSVNSKITISFVPIVGG